MNVCTIIAKNYVAHARVLARSLAEHHPEARLWTLFIDDSAGYIDAAQEPFEVLTPAAIGCEPFEQMAVRYSVLELSTAVKPWLLRHLLNKTGAPITYLDPDIKVYGSLEKLQELAGHHGVVLIPHNTAPIPSDGRRPSQIDIMISGVYNLGYISVAPTSDVDKLVDWWAERLLRDCRHDPVYGYFVDQRWFDLAPGFLTDVAIVRDPEYNVAYWNLYSRRLEHDSGRYLVDGHPLAFFHFSGFDPTQPLVLSRFQDRVDVLRDPVLERLLAEYAKEVMDEGHAASRKWPYGHAAMGDGTKLDEMLRSLYDPFLDDRGGEVPSPFTPEGARLFLDWLGEQAHDARPGISRALQHVYENRPDLQEAYPDLTGEEGRGLLRWAEEYGRREVPLLRRLMTRDDDVSEVASSARSADDRAPAATEQLSAPLREAPWGVNVVGYFRSELGVAEVARQLVIALDAKDVPVLPVHGPTIPLSRQGHPYLTAAPAEAVFPVNVICMNADMLPEFASHVDEDFFAGRYSIGLWSWEVNRFPDRFRNSLSFVEEVWAHSEHIAAALRPLAPVPVTTIRIPVQPPPDVPISRSELGLPEQEFLFLFSFDYLSVFKRKNPLAVIEAFRRTFDAGEGARLILKCINADRDPHSHAELLSAVAGNRSIQIIDSYMSPSENNSLTALCDCYVSLHRAEGFGFGMAEAMSMGKPVIATGYSGNLDFMTPSNSLLVNYRLVPIGPGGGPYPAEGQWAAPDLEHASSLMRKVFADRDGARQLGAQAADDIRRTHSPAAAGEIIRRRLEEIWAGGRTRRAAQPRRKRASLAPWIEQQPFAGNPRTGGRARGMARTAMLRAMRPFTTYQQSVNAEMASSLDELNGAVAGFRGSAVQRARLLHELRSFDQLRRLPSLVEAHACSIEDLKRDLMRVNERMTGAHLQTDRAVYLALSELRRRHTAIAAEAGEPPETRDLSGFELRAFSQNGEDGVLAETLRRTGTPAQFFVEVGVETGREGNCIYLADVAGWDGLFIESDDAFYRVLERKYAAQSGVQTLRALVTPGNIEQLFAQAEVPSEPDVLSIDVDGEDYWIWESIDAYRPRVVVIEYNSALDPRRRLVQPNEPEWRWDGSDYFGASLGALQTLAEHKGYRLVHTDLCGVNAFFVRDDLVRGAFPEPEDVAVRGAPNYFHRGYHHPSASAGRRYVDLDTGDLVEVAAHHAAEPR